MQRKPTPTKEERKKEERITKDKKVKKSDLPKNEKSEAQEKQEKSSAKKEVWSSVDIPQEFTKEVNEYFLEFMAYKKSRKEAYKSARSIKSLYSKWAKAINEFGVANLILSIEETFSNNYAGVFPKDHDDKKTKYGKGKKFNGSNNGGPKQVASKYKRFAQRRGFSVDSKQTVESNNLNVQEF